MLVCATDAGGARNLAPVAALAIAQGWRVTAIGSHTTLPLFVEAGVAARIAAVSDAASAAVLLGHLAPQAILCGTTRYRSAERHLIAASRALGIRSLVVLDELYSYRSRFADDADALTGLPDRVCCPNALAMTEAMGEGLPADRLCVTGSPALAALADRVAAFATAPPPPPTEWSAGNNALRLLFISETHHSDYGGAVGQAGPLGPFLGYTEAEVRRDLARALAGPAMPPCQVVEKLHPSAAAGDLKPPEDAAGPWRVVARTSLWPLLYHADLVVGMRSMALLEAALFGHRPLAYQPDLIGEERCTAVRLGLADAGRRSADLTGWLHRHRHRTPRGHPLRPPFAAATAAAQVLWTAGFPIGERTAGFPTGGSSDRPRPPSQKDPL